MNLIIAKLSDVFQENGEYKVVLDKRQSHHCINILHVKISSRICMGILNRGKGNAVVTDINDFVTVTLCSSFHREIPIKVYPSIVVVIGMPRPKAFSRILENITSLGVIQINIIALDNGQKCYLNSSRLTSKSIEEHVMIGLEQSTRTLSPEVNIFASLKGFFSSLKFDSVHLVVDQNCNFIPGMNCASNQSFSCNKQDLLEIIDGAENCNSLLKFKSNESRNIHQNSELNSKNHIPGNICQLKSTKTTFLLAHPKSLEVSKNNEGKSHIQSDNGKSFNALLDPSFCFDSKNFPLSHYRKEIQETDLIIIAVGGENGWTNEDIESFKNKFGTAFKIFNIGDSVLKCDHAITFILGQISMLNGRAGINNGYFISEASTDQALESKVKINLPKRLSKDEKS